MLQAERQHYHDELLSASEELYSKSPNWISFYREVLGLGGLSRRMFPTRESLEEFEKSDTYEKIQRMVARLREKPTATNNHLEPTRVITVRLPKSLHESLRVEAHEHHTSMNKLCISKLLQFIDNKNIPSENFSIKR